MKNYQLPFLVVIFFSMMIFLCFQILCSYLFWPQHLLEAACEKPFVWLGHNCASLRLPADEQEKYNIDVTNPWKNTRNSKKIDCQCYKGSILESIQPIFHGDHVDLVPVLFYPKFKLRRNLDKINLVDKDSYLRCDHYRSQYTWVHLSSLKLIFGHLYEEVSQFRPLLAARGQGIQFADNSLKHIHQL